MRTTTLIFLANALILSGCSDFLQEDMQGIYSSGTFYKTADQAELALTGIYNITSFTNPNNNIWVFGDVASDDAVKGGNPGDQSNIQFIDDFTYISSNSYLLNLWSHYYEGIGRANYLLASLDDIEMNGERKLSIQGESLFLRSYFYFQLTNVFGSIPLKLDPPTTKESIHVPLSTPDAILSQVASDLETAVASLPVSNLSGHISKGGAIGLLAKVKLFQGDYGGVLEAVQDIDDLGIYGLTSRYDDNFTLGNQDNDEVLFKVNHVTGASPKLGSSLNQWFAPQPESGYHFNSPTQDFVDEFEVTAEAVADPRLDYSVGREGQEWLNGEAFDPTWSPTGFISKKHLQPLSEVAKGIKGDGGLSYVYLRYAEVLLMKAEALNENGQTADALTPLNAVRKRARESYLYDESLTGFGSVPANLLPDIASTNQGIVRDAIRHERRVELGLEFHRFFDLMRYGKSAAEPALSGTGFDYDQHRYFVLPLAETDINQGIK